MTTFRILLLVAVTEVAYGIGAWDAARRSSAAGAPRKPHRRPEAVQPHAAGVRAGQGAAHGGSEKVHRSTLDNSSECSSPSPAPKDMRVLLYITTVGSVQHMSFLECGAELFSRMPRLSQADALLYVGRDGPEAEWDTGKFQQLVDAWPMRHKSVRFGVNPGFQAGAMKSVHDGFAGGWFEGYDWVIRINPDVIIYDERPLFSLMEQRCNWGIFNICGRQGWQGKHGPNMTDTDFFAVRPEHVPKDAFADWESCAQKGVFAESQATRAFKPIYESGNYAWLKENARAPVCRLQDGGIWHATGKCPECLAAHGWTESFMTDPYSEKRIADLWQENWRP